MRELREYKILVFNKTGKVLQASKHRNVYNDELGMFEHDKLKKQLYDNKDLKKFNWLIYGRDYKIIAFSIEGTLYELQGYKDWANVKRYVEQKEGHLTIKSKNLIKRAKDIERAFEKGLNEQAAKEIRIADFKRVNKSH